MNELDESWHSDSGMFGKKQARLDSFGRRA